MDMKANMGSFAAALKNKDVWVMNVVPEDGPNTLKIVYDRGLIGTVHNWYVLAVFLRSFDLTKKQKTRFICKMITYFLSNTPFALETTTEKKIKL